MLKNLILQASNFFKKIFHLPLTLIEKFKKSRAKKRSKEDWKESLKTVLYAFLLALLIRSFLFEPFHIPSSSMKPNLLVGDFIFVSKFSYGYSRYSFPLGLPLFKNRTYGAMPKRGDVIVFRLPRNPRINYIKRLIGLPGDKIQMRRGVLYINGQTIPKNFTKIYTDSSSDYNAREYLETLPNGIEYLVLDAKQNGNGDNTSVYTVPENHYFFMGDNRDNSLDSRFAEGAGFVPAENLVGKAQIIFMSSEENILQFWKWHKIIRGRRIFKTIK